MVFCHLISLSPHSKKNNYTEIIQTCLSNHPKQNAHVFFKHEQCGQQTHLYVGITAHELFLFSFPNSGGWICVCARRELIHCHQSPPDSLCPQRNVTSMEWNSFSLQSAVNIPVHYEPRGGALAPHKSRKSLMLTGEGRLRVTPPFTSQTLTIYSRIDFISQWVTLLCRLENRRDRWVAILSAMYLTWLARLSVAHIPLLSTQLK